MKLIVNALNPENGETDEFEIDKNRSEKILKQMDACKWLVDDSDQINDQLHVIGINRYDLACWMADSNSLPLEKCRGFHVFAECDFPNTKNASKMRIEHGNSFFTQSEQTIKFDSVEEQCKFWDNMMSNLMTPEEIEMLHKAELEPNVNEVAPEVKDKEQCNDKDSCLSEPKRQNVEIPNNLNMEIGRIADLYAIDVVTKMLNSLDKIRNSNDIAKLEKNAISLWSEYIGKFGKK